MRRLGVTGAFTNTCGPAACDRSSYYGRVTRSDYEGYSEFEPWWNGLTPAQRIRESEEWENMYDRIFRSLGGFTCRQVLFHCADSEADFVKTARRWLRYERQVIVDILWDDIPHALGLMPTDDPEVVWAVSTAKPRELYGLVTLGQIFEVGLSMPEHTQATSSHYDPERYPFHNSNMMGLPQPK